VSSFEVSWRDEVSRYVVIDAESKEDASRKWSSGEYDINDTIESDSNGLFAKQEIIDEMSEIADV